MRAGCASPGLLPTGMVLLETTRAKSGLPRRVPLLATVLEGCLFVGTARGARSRKLRSRRRWDVDRAVAEGLLPAATACGWQFAVISPERAGCGPAPGAASGAAD